MLYQKKYDSDEKSFWANVAQDRFVARKSLLVVLQGRSSWQLTGLVKRNLKCKFQSLNASSNLVVLAAQVAQKCVPQVENTVATGRESIMNLRRILCPIDFSIGSANAIELASNLASKLQASIDFVHVWQPVNLYAEYQAPLVAMAAEEADASRLLESIHPTKISIEHRHHLLIGDPVSEIVQFASDKKSDMVIMGTHGRTGLARWILGSVAEGVIRRSPCPVLTCKTTVACESNPEPELSISSSIEFSA